MRNCPTLCAAADVAVRVDGNIARNPLPAKDVASLLDRLCHRRPFVRACLFGGALHDAGRPIGNLDGYAGFPDAVGPGISGVVPANCDSRRKDSSEAHPFLGDDDFRRAAGRAFMAQRMTGVQSAH